MPGVLGRTYFKTNLSLPSLIEVAAQCLQCVRKRGAGSVVLTRPSTMLAGGSSFHRCTIDKTSMHSGPSVSTSTDHPAEHI